MNENISQPLVTIQCLVYNHEPYLRDCLNGFVMQETDFKFEAIVHDDCSTDHSADIIREYAEKYPDIIKPIYEKENQYSKRGILHQIMMDATRGKYVALCEGDDFWTDPLKLQKQVSFLEAHPDYSMCCASAYADDGKTRKVIGTPKNVDLTAHEMIIRGGAFIPTLSIVYLREAMAGYEEFHGKISVGDYPTQIYCGIKGRVRFLHDIVGTYRISSTGSWTARTFGDRSKAMQFYKSEIEWFHHADAFTQRKYHKSFRYVIGKDLYSIYDLDRGFSKKLRGNIDVLYYALRHLSLRRILGLLVRIYQ